MACCLILLRLLAPLAARLGLDRPATTAPRIPIVPAVVLGMVELGGAWAILGWAGRPGTHLHQATDDPAGGSGQIAAGSLVELLLVVAILALARQRSGKSGALTATLGSAVGVVAALIALSAAAGRSHLVLMLVVEAALVVAPLLIVGPERNARPADDLWAVARCAITALTAGAATFFLVTVHLPAAQGWYVDSGRLTWWLTPTLLAAGLAFWSSVLRFRLPSAWRALALVLVLETGAVVGLVLLVAGHPLMPMEPVPVLGLGPVADQRLAGAVMMAIDLLVLIWMIDPVLNRSTGPATSSASRRLRSLPR